MTSGKALMEKIKRHCIHCCGGYYPERCSGCALTHFKFGHSDGLSGKGTTAKLLKTIKAECLECASTRTEVENCTSGITTTQYHTCELWPYRLGKDPHPKPVSEDRREAGKALGQRFKENLIRRHDNVIEVTA